MARPAPAWSPALREGVAASRVVVSGGPYACVADFLAARFPRAPDWAPRLLTDQVVNDSGQPLRAHSPCPSGMLIWYWRAPPPEPRVPFEIELLFQDEQLVVVDKPHFLPVAPSGRFLHETVLVRLKRLLGIHTLSPMHRIDLDTAGVVVFTVQPSQRNAYQELLRQRHVHKVYEAVAPWREDLVLPQTVKHRLQEPPGKNFMQIQVVAGEPNAVTMMQVLQRLESSGHESNQPLALYQLTPSTGRRHQLRVQMNALGLPIVGDRIYPVLHPELPPGAMPDHSRPLQLLSREFSFTDPLSGQHRSFVSRRQLQLAGWC